MRMHERNTGDVVILELSGNLMGGADAVQFQERLDFFIGKGFRRMIIDLEGVNLVSSSGIGMMVGGVKSFQEAGGNVQLVSLRDRVCNIFKINKLDMFFHINTNVDQALRYFNRD